MGKRYVTIWFRHLKTDWFTLRHPDYINIPFVLVLPIHGRIVITAANQLAKDQGIDVGMAFADARAIFPSLKSLNDKPEPSGKLLKAIAEWCIRFSPVVALDPPDGLIIDATGCAHLWGSEKEYLTLIYNRFKNMGYHIQTAMADTIGCAWAFSRFGNNGSIIEAGEQKKALPSLTPAALRIELETVEHLSKLGLCDINSFISMPRQALHRRFGKLLLQRLDQALGYEEEFINAVKTPAPYQERLTCLELIMTATGIEIALKRLLETLCSRLQQEGKGIRTAFFKCFRVDGKIEKIDIGTTGPSNNVKHLLKLFELKLETIEPAFGIELFILEASKVEQAHVPQEKLWKGVCGIEDIPFTELLDRIANKIGSANIHRYLPDEHYWPERSIKLASSIQQQTLTKWLTTKQRPLQLLSNPEYIEVTAPIPDYPPMLFRYKGKLHKIRKADGPERIEPEWWIQEGEHRDYYAIEDEEGFRFWVFRSGHYKGDKSNQWFMHGFFA
jgi:protein ImuB